MKYYIISGEASGDLHASNLIKALKRKDASADFRVWAGDLSEAEGATLVKHYRDLAFMGFKEVVANLRTIFRNIRYCKEDIVVYKPDAIIFIDYPGFNMRIAEWARKEGYRTVYYISPQIWAWKASRAWKLKRDIDKMIVILPFEEAFYKNYDYPVRYVGHPLLDVTENFHPSAAFRQKNGLNDKPIIAILPGSRKQEIWKKLPVMLAAATHFPEYQFVIAGAPGQQATFYKEVAGNIAIPFVFGQTYDLLSRATAAMVTSGTATLETALFEVPQVVCYKGSKISYAIGRRLVKVRFISLVNLIMDREVVKELIQDDMNEAQLVKELRHILQPAETARLKADYRSLKAKLGGEGASNRAAAEIWAMLG